MPTVRVQLFGAPLLERPAGAHALAADRLGQLAVVLAVRGDWTTRDELIALLWPDLAADAARRNLRKLLFRARREDWFSDLETRADTLRWRVASDLRDFEVACTRGDWPAAAAFYQAVFAEGFELGASAPFVEWLRFARHRLAARFRAAAVHRLAQLGGDAGARAAVAQQWLACDPLDEDALVAAAEAARAQGFLGETRRLVAEFSQRLAVQVGVAPSARVEALVGERAAPTPRPDPDFIGRRAELLELQALLARTECRMLTITGPGGVGKSRLARVALAREAPAFEIAQWIGLDDLADLAQVAPRIAQALRVPLAGTTDPLEQVAAALRGVRALLVLDNAEHVAGLPGLCETLLQTCADLKLMLTSRSRLALAGEWLLPVTGLPVPDADETEIDALRAFDAMRLFEQRAHALSPAFAAAGNAVEVARLVRLLDGTPLAIELAAAWVRMLPVADIRRDIESSLDLLAGGDNAPDRRRSVRASFEHSWRLLSPIEQRCLAQMSVFAAPFTREAAAHVAGASLPVLAALADKSLLRALGDGRFAFHPLMQQCAREQLGDAAAVQQRHLDYFAQWLAHVPARDFGQARILDAIEAVLADSRAAWRHAVETRSTGALEAMAPILSRFFDVRGRQADGLGLFEAALGTLAATDLPRSTRAALLRGIGTLHYRNGDLVLARPALREAEQLFRGLKNPAAQHACVLLLALLQWMNGDLAGARRGFEHARELALVADDDAGCAQAINGMALCARASGDLEGALALHRQALSRHETAGDTLGEAVVLHDLGSVLYSLRRYEESCRTLQRALALSESNGLATVREFCLISLGHASIELQQLDAAETYLQQAMRADLAAGASLVSTMLRLGLARVAVRRGDLDGAAPLLRDALQRARGLESVPTQLVAVAYAAEWLDARGKRERAAALWTLISVHPHVDHGTREDALFALERLRLTPAESHCAAQANRGAEVGTLVDDLIAALAA